MDIHSITIKGTVAGAEPVIALDGEPEAVRIG